MSRGDEPSPAQAGGPGQPPLSALRSANLAVRLLCELGLLAGLAVWGFRAGVGLGVKLLLGLGAPLLAVVLGVVVAVNIVLVRALE